MASTVVGVFDNRNEAEQARQELVSAGFSQNDARIIPQQAAAASASGGRAGQRDEGFWDNVKDFFGFSDDEDAAYYREATTRGGTLLQVTCASEQHEDRAIQILQRYNAVDLDQRSQQWRSEGWQGYQSTQARAGATGAAAGQSTHQHAQASRQGETASIPVVEEQLQVGKRAVRRGGVRVHTHVTEKPVEAQVNLREEHVRVERRPVDRPASEADFAAANRQGTIEVTETAEQAVVAKQARVVEEVVVDKEATERTETVRDTVRRTDVDIEKTDPNQQGRTSSSHTKDRV